MRVSCCILDVTSVSHRVLATISKSGQLEREREIKRDRKREMIIKTLDGKMVGITHITRSIYQESRMKKGLNIKAPFEFYMK